MGRKNLRGGETVEWFQFDDTGGIDKKYTGGGDADGSIGETILRS